MKSIRSEVWQEMKDGFGFFFKIIAYTILVLVFCFGVGYVCINCCQ